ncbi:MAG TPA: hypothetical protein VFT45_03480 [Longimicrobium sp.]|nr:hypothetical protein [Longimicrobium sp.]
MRASSLRFARALAERIGEVLPPPLTIRVDDENLVVSADGIVQGGSAAAVIVEEDDDRTVAERLETAGRAVLSGVQDCVSEYLALPWPGDADGGMAIPGVRVDAERVHLWFGGSESAPVVSLRPIDLDELIER